MKNLIIRWLKRVRSCQGQERALWLAVGPLAGIGALLMGLILLNVLNWAIIWLCKLLLPIAGSLDVLVLAGILWLIFRKRLKPIFTNIASWLKDVWEGSKK